MYHKMNSLSLISFFDSSLVSSTMYVIVAFSSLAHCLKDIF